MRTSTPNSPLTRTASTLVRIEIPRSLEYVPMARIAVAGYAARLGFDMGEVEDSRIAVDELTSLLVEAGAGPTVELSLQSEDATLFIEGHCRCVVGVIPTVDPITQQVLGAVVDEYEIGAEDTSLWFRSSRRRRRRET